MKLTIIHGVYKRNPLIAEALYRNLLALREAEIEDYQYIVFNDKGDKEIYGDLAEYAFESEDVPLISKFDYIYSEKNFGKKKCRGAWIGALPYIKGDVVHFTDQDDIMSSNFYKYSLKALRNNNIDLVFSNSHHINESMEILHASMDPRYKPDYNDPINMFKFWFGIEAENKITRANNFMMSSGVIYRLKLHNEIGIPDLDEFEGAADFEYWSRVLFNEKKCKYISEPNWFYMKSQYTAANEIIDGKSNGEYWLQLAIEKVKNKYNELWKEKELQEAKY